MMIEGGRHALVKRKLRVRSALHLAATLFAVTALPAAAAPESGVGTLQLTPQVDRLLEDADKALQSGNINLALLQLKNAVRLAPANGEVRARLGIALLQTGQAVAAERELRQARNDDAPTAIVVPALLQAMLRRNEFGSVLAEFPEPPQGKLDVTAADVLRGRALALQMSGKPQDARAAMERALSLGRDVTTLVAAARLAREQRDLALAQKLADEALTTAPADESAMNISVVLASQAGNPQKALAIADEFLHRVPQSQIAKVLRITTLLELKDDAKAKEDVDALLKQDPRSMYGRFYRGVLTARANDNKGAWQQLQGLPPEFMQSDPSFAMMAAVIAAASGKLESGGAILTTLLARHPDIAQARLQLAAIRLSQRSPQAAVDTLAPLKNSNDASVHALLAQAYIQLKQYNEALASLEIASSTAGGNDLLMGQLALSRLQVGETDEAIKGLRDLVQRNPGNINAAGPLAVALARAAKWDEALRIVDDLTKASPNSPLLAFDRGQILVGSGKLGEAKAAFDRALMIDSNFLPALYYRANVSIARGDTEAAKKDLESLLERNPGNALAYMRLTKMALDNGREQEGLALLQRAIGAVPKDPMPRLALATYQFRRGRYKEAQVTINGLLQVSRNNPDGLALRAEIQLQQGDTVDAIKSFRALAAANGSSAPAYRLLAEALYQTKDQRAAEDAAKKAIELAPDSPQMRAILIDIQIGGGDPEAALATARAYAKTKPGPDADLLLANTLQRLKRQNEAEAVLNASLTSNPNARVASRLAQLAMASGDTKKVRAILSNWTSKNVNDFGMQREYATYLMQLGDLAGARKLYETLLKQHPEDPIILNNLGWLVQKDDPNRALSMTALAAKIAPQSAEITDSLGWLKYQLKDTQGALPVLQRAHDIDASSGAISYHLALALDANGKRAEAKSLLQTALSHNAAFDGADDARQVLTRW